MDVLVALAVFFAAYLANTIMITVGYHRGLAHGSVALTPAARRFVARAGIWFTGLDPKGWVVMHRRHHAASDTEHDPHSPVHYGLLGVLLAQLRNYERTLVGLAKENPEYTAYAEDLDFEINWLNRKGVWFLPYVVHGLVAVVLAYATGMWAVGVGYFVGIMSHPIEGWIVNALGHAVGGRNFETADNSRNNHLAAWLILGEGFQNNHHSYPASAKFSYRPWEVDLGYGICLGLERLGALTIERNTLIPSPEKERTSFA